MSDFIMSLKNACDNLESTFVNTEAKLDEVTDKVDKIILKADSTAITANGPSHLLETLKGIKKEHQEIVKQVEGLKDAQNVFVSEILKDLNKLQEAENRLVAKIGGEEVLKTE